jgi:hypothetical protein
MRPTSGRGKSLVIGHRCYPSALGSAILTIEANADVASFHDRQLAGFRRDDGKNGEGRSFMESIV